jgi:pyruvate,water dikinase
MAELAYLYQYAFHLTHVAGQGVFVPITGRLTALLEGRFPVAEVNLLVQEVGQGANSATVDSDRAIARMAKLANADAALARALDSPSAADALAAIENVAGAGPFRAELSAYLETYGVRCQDWDIYSPTVRERPEIVIDMIRQSMRNPRDPDELRAGALAVREDAIRRITVALADDAESLAAAKQCTDALEDYIAVREGRAMWQLMGAGSFREALLRKGEALVQSGAISNATDVFFLLGDEIEGAPGSPVATDGLRALVATRMAERESWKGITPPRLISANPDLLAAGAHGAGSGDVLRGLPASCGTVTAVARVILELEAADEMEPGEVLVCAMTSPPWTPLIGMASALVTNSGAAFSHSAIAAREYGIPCVVGTDDATLRIRTGDIVAVDGDAGTVTILSSTKNGSV